MIKLLFKILLFTCLLFSLFSCNANKTVSSSRLYDPKEVARLSEDLGIAISNMDKNDDKNMPLYAESSLWLGVPYRYGGTTKKGVDCSGFTHEVFKKVYRQKLPRSTKDLDNNMKKQKVAKNKLQTGDLVFFATSKDKKRVNHVGIYLKDNYFVHASTSRGVMVSHLDEKYYRIAWKYAARVR